jgi:hypothetical protein
MSLVLLPNMEALVGAWLREHPDIQALDARVAGATPSSTTRPWIRVIQLAAPARREHLATFVLQLDCYAGSQATTDHVGQTEARTVKATARAILHSIEGSSLDGVVVSKVRFTGDTRAPDTELEPARERYILTVEITAHGVVS